jgi:hypothetical protein
MSENKMYKIVVFVPVSHADIVRTAMGDAGAGTLGEYSHCSFTSKGVGRYKGSEKSNPFNGKAGMYESVEEERIEVSCSELKLRKVIETMKEVHPYEEVAFDIYPLTSLATLNPKP